MNDQNARVGSGMQVCLTMIVRNEEPVVARCLASVRPLLARWVIVDTGSEDDTEGEVQRALEGVPGRFHKRPWRGFGRSRTEAFELARALCRQDGLDLERTYALVVDADDVIERPPPFESLEASDLPILVDAYALEVTLGTYRYRRPQLFRLSKSWRYVGPVHEVAACDEPTVTVDLDALRYVCHRDGKRSQRPDHEKYRDDALVLEAAMRDEPENTRHVFYAAQSWRDAGDHARARNLYLQHSEMPPSSFEEAFVSLLEAARAGERLEDPDDAVVRAYLRAYTHRPARAEPLCDLARFLRLRNRLPEAWVYASAAARTPYPTADRLFVASDVYEWRARDEEAVAGYHIRRFDEARRLNVSLLGDGKLPESERPRVKDNLRWCERMMGIAPVDAPTAPEDAP